MGPARTNIFVHITLLYIVIRWVATQDYSEEKHKHQVRIPPAHLKKIPKQFDVKGENAIATFNKYLADIQELASKKNVSIVYKVRVDTLIKNKHKNLNKSFWLNKKSKKYNIPLKKKNMKLSTFEIILRKRANDVGLKHRTYKISTTEGPKLIYTTRQIQFGKYKPEIGAVKIKFAKIIHPVRNREITL